MKAIMINQHGGPEVLEYTENFSNPEKPSNSEATVKLAYTSINRVDTVIRKGYPGLTIPFPHIIGGDIAGTIESVDDNVTAFKSGDKVVAYPIVLPNQLNPRYGDLEHLNDGWKYFGMHLKGSYSEYVNVPISSLIKLPEDFPLENAAALPISGLTAYHALKTVAELKKGDTFLIWGASGGFGTLAVQIAKIMGATVIATTTKEWKKDYLRNLGADYVLDTYSDNVLPQIKEINPLGVDVIMEYVGPATFPQSFNAVRKGGRIILCGMLTGMEINLHIQQTYFRHINISGVYLGTRNEFRELIQLFADGKITPHIHKIYKFNEVREAHKLFESGEFIGKILLQP